MQQIGCWVQKAWTAMRNKEEGQALAEYGLVLVLVVIAAVVAVTYFRTELTSVFQRMGDALR